MVAVSYAAYRRVIGRHYPAMTLVDRVSLIAAQLTA